MTLYEDEVNFDELAARDPEFAATIRANDGRIDFQDPRLVKYKISPRSAQLTVSLLRRDFGVLIDLPDDRLCPPVPIRYSYVQWIQNLLASTNYETEFSPSKNAFFSSPSNRTISGLDIGTGASCIYPLLFIASTNNWSRGPLEKRDNDERADRENAVVAEQARSECKFNIIATDTDPYSLKWAEHNIALNSASISTSSSSIRTVLTNPSDPLLLPLINSVRSQNEVLGLEPGSSTEIETDTERLDFTMCNPPFYSSVEELQQSFADKDQTPAAVCTGSVSEMIYQGSGLPLSSSLIPIEKDTPASESSKNRHSRVFDFDTSSVDGGDAAFALRILAESSDPSARHLVRWYSCMMGKLSSLKFIIDQIKKIGVSNWAVCQLKGGKRTKRWAVAWSWSGARPSNAVARHELSFPPLLPASTECTIHLVSKFVNQPSGLQTVCNAIDRQLKGLDLEHWSWDAESTRTDDVQSTLQDSHQGCGITEGTFATSGIGMSRGNVWSRAARRRKKHRILSPDNPRQIPKSDNNMAHDNSNLGNHIPQSQSRFNSQNTVLSPATSSGSNENDNKNNNNNNNTRSRKRRRTEANENDEPDPKASFEAATNQADNNSSREDHNASERHTTSTTRRREARKDDEAIANVFAFRISVCVGDSIGDDKRLLGAVALSATTVAGPGGSAGGDSSSDGNTGNGNGNGNGNGDNGNGGIGKDKNNDSPSVTITIRWLFGHDRIVFESFCGMMRRALLHSTSSSSSATTTATTATTAPER